MSFAEPPRDLDPLGHLGVVQPYLERLRHTQDQQTRVAGFRVGAYGVAYRSRPQEVILFGVDAAGREFAMRYTPPEAEALQAKLRQQSNLARGLPAEGLEPPPDEAKALGQSIKQVMDMVHQMGVPGGTFVARSGGHAWDIEITPHQDPPDLPEAPPE